MRKNTRNIALATASLAFIATAAMAAPASARQGADDPMGHDANDDRVTRVTTPAKHVTPKTTVAPKATVAKNATTSTTVDDRGRRHGGHGADD